MFDSSRRDHFKPFSIRWGEYLGMPDCPYMRRWVITFFGYSIRLHHWMASDDQRALHDHPWWMVVFIIKGGYIDLQSTDIDVENLGDIVTAGAVRFRKATHRHTVWVPAEGCWSLLFTGRPVRQWGFYPNDRTKMMRPLRYFSRYGHHQCED